MLLKYDFGLRLTNSDLGVFVVYWRVRRLTVFLKILAYAGILLVVGANGFEIESLLVLIFIPLFFVGKPWYKYLSKKTTK